MSTPAPSWRDVRNVLAVRLDNLGDLLMTTPALAAIRETLPGVKLTLLCSPAGLPLAPHLREVDQWIGFSAPWVKREKGSGSEAELIERLEAEQFDAAVIFTVCTQSALPAALLCRMAGIPLRLAYCRENPYHLLTHWLPETDRPGPGMRHEVRRQLDLVASIGMHGEDRSLRLHFGDADRQSVHAQLRQAGIDPQQPYIVVHAGATAASRRYPEQRFVEAATELASLTGFQAVLVELPGDCVARAQACSRARMRGLQARLSLGELAALISGAEVTLCNNSAPSHVAAAVGAPVVVLYALTNPQHTPWLARARVLNQDVPCRECLKSVCPERHHACLRGVQVGQVVEAAMSLVAPPMARAAGTAA